MTKFKTLFDNAQEALRSQPEAAAISFATEGRLVESFRSEVQARQFQINADKPESLGGTVTLDSPASAEDLARLRAAVDAHCPGLDSLRNPIPVELTINHVGESAVAAE